MQRFVVILALVGTLGLARVAAQATPVLSLTAATTTLQTGTTYPVDIRLDDVSDLWLASVEITYDPDYVYILGTQSGSPVKSGDLFDPAEASVIGNSVQNDTIMFTYSQFAPADPVNGSGVLGSIQIFPLQAGTTQLRFRKAELTKVHFEEQDGRRVGVSTSEIAFTPVLLELTITGEMVTPPPEHTATPTASPTADVALLFVENSATPESTLVNVTAAPRPSDTPQPLVTLTPATRPDDASSAGNALPLVLGLVFLLGGGGLLGWLVLRLRR
jgi:hypothetical protein